LRTQTKIAIIFFCTTLATILLLSAGLYYFIIRYSFADFYKRLEIRGVVTARATLDHETASASILKEVRDMHLEKLPEEQEYFFSIEPGKSFESESAQLNLPIGFFQKIITTGSANHQLGSTFFTGIRYDGKEGPFVVIVSAANYYTTTFLSYLRNVFFIGILVVALLTLFVSIFFSHQVFNPVKKIASQAREISSRSLHLRLQNSKQNDEIGELEDTFNNMLDRLETSFATQNNFISNASHEFNTPLTTIIGETEVALSKRRTPEEYMDSLRIVLDTAERLRDITKSLFYLAQTGFNGKVDMRQRLRADQLLWDVKDTISKINPQSNVQINLNLMPDNPEQLKIKGNEKLLHIALSNLVSNACKYSGNQLVTLSIGTSERDVIIVVKDNGIGIPEEEIPFIYDPFFRASNTKPYEGYGIGLPLSRNIVRLHQGSIQVTSRVNVGTTVQLNFPIDHLRDEFA
jgi:signal transduction histidine kinase